MADFTFVYVPGVMETSSFSSSFTTMILLSRRKVYSILYSSTLILPSNRRGERLLRLFEVAGCCGREQEALYYYSEIQVVYIVII